MNKKLGHDAIYDARELGIPRMLLLGLQHLFAMFGATVLVPILVTGYGLPLSIQTTLLFAGIGTLLFHVCTKFKVPAFLGSSFAFLGGFQAVADLNTGKFAAMTGEEKLPYALGDVVDVALNLSVYESARGAQLSGRIIDLHPAGLGAELARQAALVQALRRGTPLTEEQKKQIVPARTDIIAVYRELQSRRWHAEDLQPLCAKLGEEQTGKTLVAVAALEQVGLITAAEKGGAKFWELVPTAGNKNLADAPILKCLEEL